MNYEIDIDELEASDDAETGLATTGADGGDGLSVKLSRKKVTALNALITKRPKETLIALSQRTGVPNRSLHRYLKDKEFYAALQEATEIEVGRAEYPGLVRDLIANARLPGASASSGKLALALLGKVIADKVEISGNVAMGPSLGDLMALMPLTLRQAIVEAGEAIQRDENISGWIYTCEKRPPIYLVADCIDVTPRDGDQAAEQVPLAEVELA